MTDQQPHTPTTEQVRLAHAESVTFHVMEEPELTEANNMFDRWYVAEIAAAEQRGAVKALRSAAESDDLIDHMLTNLRANQPIAVRETSKYLHNRADLLEGDDG